MFRNPTPICFSHFSISDSRDVTHPISGFPTGCPCDPVTIGAAGTITDARLAFIGVAGTDAASLNDYYMRCLTDGLNILIDGDLLEGAIKFAEKVVADKTPLKRARDLKVKQPNADAFLLDPANKDAVGQGGNAVDAAIAAGEAFDEFKE